jgi:ankyrin repeat protein
VAEGLDPQAVKLVLKAAKHGDCAALQSLLAEQPGLLDARDTDGSTPLHCACWKGNLDAARVLLDAGADVNAVNANDHWGTTPLHAAAHANQREIAALLLERGADRDARDGNGRTPLEHTEVHKATAAARVLRGS